MKKNLLFSLLFCAMTLPAFGELTPQDLDKIRLIVYDAQEPIKKDIAEVKAEVAQNRGRLEGIEKLSYGIIALIIVAVGIPQILIAWRGQKERALEKEVQHLAQEIETLKQHLLAIHESQV